MACGLKKIKTRHRFYLDLPRLSESQPSSRRIRLKRINKLGCLLVLSLKMVNEFNLMPKIERKQEFIHSFLLKYISEV